ncbi:H-NS family nucleoid-associated regulatory protein [Paraburkholderia sp. XV]|uniref:H-NS family nucleoid-associated regulatory protein n=1 Tax=Paraburkholderia sp. XV TaxID=2831520 RepID=UPI001CD2BE1E|nr:H-NS family nucleoid-associated regulatory protein [Paraburkholderia sp. XV]
MVTLENIQAKIAKLQTQAETLIQKQSSGVLEKIRGLMEKHGITTADIEAHMGGGKRGRKGREGAVGKQRVSSAKYRDPTSGATWTGHGRAPAWIASVKNRSRFLVDGGSPNPAALAKKPATGNYVRGPQPPKYRDPKTGAAWSGRGRVPAWLAGAGEDRTGFLIA